MRRLISRPSRVFPFAALAACGMAGDGRRVLYLLCVLALSRGLSLSAGMSFRDAAGSIVNHARLQGNFLAAFLLSLLGSAASVLLCVLPQTSLLGAADFYLCLTGALLSVTLTLSDRLHVAADGISAPLLDFVTGLLLAAGLLLSADDGRILAGAAGLSAFIGLMVCLVNTRPLRARPGWKILTKIPRGLLRGWAVPAVLGLIAFLCVSKIPAGNYSLSMRWNDWNIAACCLAGMWGIHEIFASPFRRGDGESDFCTIFLGLMALVVTTAALFGPEFADRLAVYQIALLVCVATLLLECPLNLKTPAMALLLIASAVAGHQYLTEQPLIGWGEPLRWIALALAVSAAAFTAPSFAGIHRRRRAERLKKARGKAA